MMASPPRAARRPIRLSVVRVAGEAGASAVAGSEDDNDDAAAPWPRLFHYDAHSTTHLNLRSAPSIDAEALDTLVAGDEVFATRAWRDWLCCERLESTAIGGGSARDRGGGAGAAGAGATAAAAGSTNKRELWALRWTHGRARVMLRAGPRPINDDDEDDDSDSDSDGGGANKEQPLLEEDPSGGYVLVVVPTPRIPDVPHTASPRQARTSRRAIATGCSTGGSRSRRRACSTTTPTRRCPSRSSPRFV